MKKIICFLCLMGGLFFMGCKKDIVDIKVKVEEPIMDIEKKEEIISFENDNEIEKKYIIVYDEGPQKSEIERKLIEYGPKLTREEFFEIFGYYPGDYSVWGEQIKFSLELLEEKNDIKE